MEWIFLLTAAITSPRERPLSTICALRLNLIPRMQEFYVCTSRPWALGPASVPSPHIPNATLLKNRRLKKGPRRQVHLALTDGPPPLQAPWFLPDRDTHDRLGPLPSHRD
jgi:hypothetical protein